ncbi:hypothetical protein VTJ04DRAFT_3123 [Mycothermus thermophilus]|uniref:uncharacterized protein n=1 Tax=Humicola insolens TaxID=85995 RepID=UPI0037439D13
MNNTRPLPAAIGSNLSANTKEEWEDWTDDEVETPETAQQDSQNNVAAVAPAAGQSRLSLSQRTSLSTLSKLQRMKSRQRQKARNELLGIKVVTDLDKLWEQQKRQRRMSERRQTRTGKFVDLAALRALEGSPSDESIGTLAWIRNRPSKKTRVEQLASEAAQPPDLSPSARPIVIGFEMPADSDVVITPSTAVVETPAVDFSVYSRRPAPTPAPAPVTSPGQPVSAWSPDTEDAMSPESALDSRIVPAVPSIPQQYRVADVKKEPESAVTPIYVDEDDDMSTPVTLFEEDGSPVATRRSLRVNKGTQRTATMVSSRSQGWWDQVTSPFEAPTPQSATSQQSPNMSQAWWKEVDKKNPFPQTIRELESESEAESSTAAQVAAKKQSQAEPYRRIPEIVVQRVSSETPASSSSSSSAPTKIQEKPTQQSMPQSEKPHSAADSSTPSPPPPPPPPPPAAAAIFADRAATPDLGTPPPYSPPSNNHRLQQSQPHYRAVFPPDHPLANLHPGSPGLANTMTSQSAIHLSDVPLTPAPLPDRPLGSFVPGDHFTPVTGYGPRQDAERRRRRHEKEDFVAWRASRCGFGACFGRPGREGRKRRRICFGVCAAILLVLVGVGVALGILLTRRANSAPAEQPSRFVNVTGFPPVPTGVSTVIAPDSKSVTACVQPPTLWTCALPKEQHETGTTPGFGPDQPPFIIQIQYDSDPKQLWRLSSGDLPTIPSTVKPNPPPPSLREMFFLGNTTDGVVSADKAGEPTPFFISILRSVNDTVGPDLLSPEKKKRSLTDWAAPILNRLLVPRQNSSQSLPPVLNVSAIAPPPDLDPDGSGRGAPAVLLPFPTQQPLRLYDKGLPTERLAFYSYYNKTTYVRSIESITGDGPGAKPVQEDLNGGSLRSEARFLVTWLFVRYKIEIWTRATGTLDGSNDRTGPSTARLLTGRVGTSDDTQPGTFPYPITITLDTHGGPFGKKFAFTRAVDERQRIVLSDTKFLLNRMNTTGDHANPANFFDESLGGMDGGTGGCKCEYKNFVGVVNGRG